MTSATPEAPASLAENGQPPAAGGRSGPRDVLIMAAWCGLAAGWLEVGTRLIGRVVHPGQSLSVMSRHFVWTVPLANALLFSAAGLLLALVARRFPRAVGWIGTRAMLAAAIVPAFLVAGKGIYSWAWWLLALGIAARLAPVFERPSSRWRRIRNWSFPVMLVLIPLVAGLLFAGDRLKQYRESRRPLPSGDAPDVLLIILDTVRADHLSLYDYPRNTSMTLKGLARRGITFTEARATAPWTLASHASFFTGRWPHELDVRWLTPLPSGIPTLAGYLGSKGYATAGFVANTFYCSSETGLDSGFTLYRDYLPDLGHLRPLRYAVLFESTCSGVAALIRFAAQRLVAGESLHRIEARLDAIEGSYRKDAFEVTREFLDWLGRRPEPRRPYFAFLNYFDAHAPYLLPEGSPLRFGKGPRTPTDFRVLLQDWKVLDKRKLAPKYRDLVVDSYDNCLGHIDNALLALFAVLEQSGRLDRTLVVVAADHGEELGEHGLFDHGESLYRPEIRVPLLFILPARRAAGTVVREIVSLRDLPATIVDLLGLSTESPFPGRSMARLWEATTKAEGPARDPDSSAFSELDEPNPSDPNRGLSPAVRGPLVSAAEGDHVYIRNQGDGREELFDERQDPAESNDLAGSKTMEPVMQRFREAIDRWRPLPPGPTR